jgi:cytochrome c-type biogenesis protein CcmE
MNIAPRTQRKLLIGLVLAGVITSVALGIRAFQQNLQYFFYPTQVVAGEAPADKTFRLGGMVLKDSIAREPGSLTVRFTVTDYVSSVPVEYTGLLPNLFGEEQGVVTLGKLDASGRFMADEIVAKHDENYMPPEVAQALEKAKGAQSGEAVSEETASRGAVVK